MCVKNRFSAKPFLFLSLLGIIFLISCQEERKNPIDFEYDPETVPSIATDSMIQFISDSGYVRYKISTKTWFVFDKGQDPYWLFPEKFYLEQYDTLRNVISTVVADSVWNYTGRRLWKLRGNVKIANSQGAKFTSQEFYWDEKTQEVYSNTDIEIVQPNKVIARGKGINANQQMTRWQIDRPYNTPIFINEDESAE